MRINLLLLLVIAFLPFPTKLVAEAHPRHRRRARLRHDVRTDAAHHPAAQLRARRVRPTRAPLRDTTKPTRSCRPTATALARPDRVRRRDPRRARAADTRRRAVLRARHLPRRPLPRQSDDRLFSRASSTELKPNGTEREQGDEHLDEQGWGGAGRVGDGAVPHGARSVRDERLDQSAGQGLRHHGDHDPGRHHPLLPDDGHADPHRSQDRRHHRPPTRVRHRLDHLRLRLGADRGVANGGRPRAGMVGARRHRCRARLPRARRADRRQLRRNPTQSGLRGDRRRRRCGDRGRSHRRRVGDDRAHVAGRVRRRGLHRRRSSCS